MTFEPVNKVRVTTLDGKVCGYVTVVQGATNGACDIGNDVHPVIYRLRLAS